MYRHAIIINCMVSLIRLMMKTVIIMLKVHKIEAHVLGMELLRQCSLMIPKTFVLHHIVNYRPNHAGKVKERERMIDNLSCLL